MSTTASKIVIYKGFHIAPTYHSSATRRPCSTVQGYIVHHPKGGDGAPCGWRKSIRSAKDGIDDFDCRAKLSAVELSRVDISDRYLERMALWCPSSAAVDALAIRSEAAKAKANEEAQAAAEHARAEKVRAAASDMLAALRRIQDYCSDCARTGQRPEASWLDVIAGAAIAKAG